MKIQVCYADDPFGMSTKKYQIYAETTDGRLVVGEYHKLIVTTGRPFLAHSELLLIRKEDTLQTKEEEVG